MGDRTDCSLTLLGEIERSKLVHIDDIVREEGGDCDVSDGEYIFTEMNYAAMPEPVRTAIVDAGLSYIWSHGSGYEYGEGCVMWDAAEGQAMSFSTNSEGLVVPVSWAPEECEIDRAALKRWVAFYARMQTGEELTVIEDEGEA